VVNYLAALGVALAVDAVVLFAVLAGPSVWASGKGWLKGHAPVSQKRLLVAEQAASAAHDARRSAEARRDAARALVDAILVAAGQYGAEFTKGDPARLAKAEADMDAVFAQAVQWRETEHFGGMMGSGYVAMLLRRATTMQDRAERHLP
jgi:hypothetical protein